MTLTAAPLGGFVFESEAASYSVGDIIEFGSYPQSQNANGSFNNDPIQWRVLSVEKDSIFVMSEKILDSQSFHNVYPYPTWANSRIRTWLNNDFYDTAFSLSEKNAAVCGPHTGHPVGCVIRATRPLLKLKNSPTDRWGKSFIYESSPIFQYSPPKRLQAHQRPRWCCSD